jgi:molybdopterin converting factor small subunit
MKVKIKLFASLREYGPEEQIIDLPDNATIEEAIGLLKLPDKFPLLRIVNGEHRPPNHHLKEGDDLALFPPIAGGELLSEKAAGIIDPLR